MNLEFPRDEQRGPGMAGGWPTEEELEAEAAWIEAFADAREDAKERIGWTGGRDDG